MAKLKTLGVYMLLFICVAFKAQDKVYFMDGTNKTVKVKEVGSDEIMVESAGSIELINKSEVLFIEYKNGLVEKYNRPEKTVVYTDDETETKKIEKKETDLVLHNRISLNTLALCNSDLALFYEHLSANQRFGVGGMGAYNFNEQGSAMNLFISVLTNPKKNYDLGAFANVYFGKMPRKSSFYMGLLFKYTNFSFTSVTDSVNAGNSANVGFKSTPAKGSQLATIFNVGTSTAITKTFFIKTLFGIGGFNMRGVYKQQYNQILNDNLPNNTPKYNRTFLLKLYLGINAGFNF